MTRFSPLMLWLGVALLAAAVASAGYLVTLGTHTRLLVAGIAAVVGLVAAGLQAQNHMRGLYLLVSAAVLFPFEFGGAGRNPWNICFFLGLFVCAVWLLDVLVLRRGGPLEQSRLVFAALAFTACTVVSIVAGLFPRFDSDGAPLGAQAAQTAIFWASVGLFLLVGHGVRDLRSLEKLTWLFLGAGALACVLHFVAMPGVIARLFSPASIGSMFWVWVVALSLSQAVLNRSLHPAARFALGALALLALYRGLFQARSWGSGWLPPLIAAGVILMFRLPRLTVVGGLLVVLLLFNSLPGISSSVMAEEEYSAMSRMEALRVLWPIILRSPVLGLGPANYYYYAELFPILGWYVPFNSHNQYVDLAAQLGLLGLLVFFWFAIETAAESWRLYRSNLSGFARAYVAGVLGGLAASVVAGVLADWILPFYYNIGIRGFRSSLLFWVFVGGLLVVRRAVNAEARTRSARAARLDEAVPVCQG